jgi:hypothetical protein
VLNVVSEIICVCCGADAAKTGRSVSVQTANYTREKHGRIESAHTDTLTERSGVGDTP